MPHVDRETMRALLGAARVSRLGTVTPEGLPHVVPVCFALEAETIYSAIDQKPKSTPRLGRLRNIRANPWAEVLADHYEEEWARLWWVRVAGPAIVDEDGPAWERGVHLLGEKYPQYRDWSLEAMIVVRVETWSGWSAG